MGVSFEIYHTKCTIDLVLTFSCLKNEGIPFQSLKEGAIRCQTLEIPFGKNYFERKSNYEEPRSFNINDCNAVCDGGSGAEESMGTDVVLKWENGKANKMIFTHIQTILKLILELKLLNKPYQYAVRWSITLLDWEAE